jgi:DNA-binding NarL/FixJ family response regulator
VAATVLIVDDHAGFRSFARALLEAEGFEVVGEAVDGASALERSASQNGARGPGRLPPALWPQ